MPPVPQRQAPPTKTIANPKVKVPNVLDRIEPLGFDDEDGIQILLYGKSGTGKTTLWGTFPKPILAVICSGGRRSGELRSLDTAENRKYIKNVKLHEVQELRTITDHILQYGEYGTVVLDHASGFQDMALSEILGYAVPEQKSWGLAQQQQWGQCSARCKELLKGFLSLRANTVIVAQERESKEEFDPDSMILPSVGAGLTPSLAGWLNTAVDYICNTYIRQRVIMKKVRIKAGNTTKEVKREEAIRGEVDFCLRTAPHPIFVTKFRIPKGQQLPTQIVDPSYEKIMALIRGESPDAATE